MRRSKKGTKKSKSSIGNIISHAFSKVGMWDFQATSGQYPQSSTNLR